MTTIHAQVELYGATEKRAFAKFLETIADADDARPKYKDVTGRPEGAQVDEDTVVAAEGIRPETVENVDHPDAATHQAVKRERGQPSPGKARRTKAEIAEDEAAAASGENGLDAAKALIAAANVAHDVMTEPVAAISTGEERVGPEDTVEDQEADAADEAAETAAATVERAAEGKPALTLDDIRTVLGNYQKVYGLPAAMEDGPKVLSEIVSGAAKVSDIPEDKIADAIAALKAAGKTNRFKRAAVAS